MIQLKLVPAPTGAASPVVGAGVPIFPFRHRPVTRRASIKLTLGQYIPPAAEDYDALMVGFDNLLVGPDRLLAVP